MALGPFLQDETTVAIAALDEAFVTHLQEHAGMTERTAAAITHHTGRLNLDDLRGRNGLFAGRGLDRHFLLVPMSLGTGGG